MITGEGVDSARRWPGMRSVFHRFPARPRTTTVTAPHQIGDRLGRGRRADRDGGDLPRHRCPDHRIAHSLGYQNLSHFRRMFHRHTEGGQTDFYDQPAQVDFAVDAIDAHFGTYLSTVPG